MSMPSIWMIGDIQGCCSSLDELLGHPEIAQDPDARFWFAGDIVNRGPQSLTTLRRLMALEERSVAILGNHDLHLLAIAAGVRRAGKNDTLLEVLEAPDAGEIIESEPPRRTVGSPDQLCACWFPLVDGAPTAPGANDAPSAEPTGEAGT